MWYTSIHENIHIGNKQQESGKCYFIKEPPVCLLIKMKILDTEIPLKNNLINSIKTHQFLWWLLIVSEILDSYSTIAFMNKDGIALEANLLIQWLALNFGIVKGVIAGKTLQFFTALCFSALSFKYSRGILILFISLNLLATIHNFSYL